MPGAMLNGCSEQTTQRNATDGRHERLQDTPKSSSVPDAGKPVDNGEWLCECGCGGTVNPGRRFRKSHQFVRPELERFWEKVNKTDTCWLWTAADNGRGYGRFGVKGRMVYAHRYSYELVKGAIPEGHDLDHLCRTTLCVNPAHLEAVTHHVNIMRGEWFIARNALKTHCLNGHEFSDENTVIYRNWRVCLSCRRESDRRRAKRKRERRNANHD